MINLSSKIHSSWLVKLQNEFNSPYFTTLNLFLKEEMNTQNIYPNKGNIFEAFNRISTTFTRRLISTRLKEHHRIRLISTRMLRPHR